MSNALVDNVQGRRFEMAMGDDVAVVYYEVEGERYVLLHTDVPSHLAVRGGFVA